MVRARGLEEAIPGALGSRLTKVLIPSASNSPLSSVAESTENYVWFLTFPFKMLSIYFLFPISTSENTLEVSFPFFFIETAIL